MSNDSLLRLMPEEARELREATERLILCGLSWLPGPPAVGSEGEIPPLPKPGCAAPAPEPSFPPAP